MIELSLRVVALCIALAGAEMLHGIARTFLVVPRIGREKAQRLGIVTGCLLAFGICLLFVPTLGVASTSGLLALGIVLSAFMAAFDAAVGRYVAKRPWRVVLTDFNPARGNLLVVGLALLVVFPWLATYLRGNR